MPNYNINDLPSIVSSLSDTDVYEVYIGGQNYKVTGLQLKTFISSGKVDQTTTVNGHALTGNITITKSDVGLSNVDNTSDSNKPVSTLQAAADAAVLASANSYTDSSIDSAIQGLQNKADARIATTANITLSGLQTIDGVLTIALDRVLVKDQTDPKENGIYVSAVGAWARSNDTNTGTELRGAVVSVDEGTTNADTTWRQTADNITIGTTNIVWVQYGAAVPDATTTTKGKAKLYASTGSNTDGAMDQNSATTAFAAETTTTIGSLINGASAKTTPVDADFVGLMDSAASNVLKKLSWLNIKATLKTYFDTLYAASAAYLLVSDLDRVSCSISSGTLTLDLNSLRIRKFLLSSAASSNFTLALSNTTNNGAFELHLNITGTVAITLPSTFRMFQNEKDSGRYNDSTRVLTLTGTTATPFRMVGNYDGTVWKLEASPAYI